MRAEDTPGGGVEVVGAVAEVFGETERETVVGEQHDAFGGIGEGD